MINDPAEEQGAHQLKRHTLDAWSWIARAREAAAKAVAPAGQAADGAAEPVADRTPGPAERDLSAD